MELGTDPMTAKIASTAPAGKRSYAQKLWVPIVLLAGLVAGELMLAATTEMEQPFGPGEGRGQYGFFHPFPTDPLFSYHVVFTTIEVALLVSLVVMYARMYVETKANFALGLVVVLGALLLQAMLSNPLIDDLFYTPSIGPGYWSPAADIVT